MAFPYDNDSDNTLDNIIGNNGEDIIANLQSEGESDVFSSINEYSSAFSVSSSEPTYNPYCFNKGTYILCLSPQFKHVWVRVENLT